MEDKFKSIEKLLKDDEEAQVTLMEIKKSYAALDDDASGTGQDEEYIEGLKADMRKAAEAREQWEHEANEARAGLEKLQELQAHELERMRQEMASERLEHAAKLEAFKAGCRNPQDLLLLCGTEELKLAEDGTAQGLAKWLAKAQTERPYLFTESFSVLPPTFQSSRNEARTGELPALDEAAKAYEVS